MGRTSADRSDGEIQEPKRAIVMCNMHGLGAPGTVEQEQNTEIAKSSAGGMDEHRWFSFVLCHKGDIDDGTRDKKKKETDCSGLYKVASMPPLIIPRRSNAYANARNQTASPSPFRTGQIMQEIKKKGKSNHRAVSATWGRHIQRRKGQREKPLMPVPGWALDPPIRVSIVGGRGLGVARNCFCGMFFLCCRAREWKFLRWLLELGFCFWLWQAKHPRLIVPAVDAEITAVHHGVFQLGSRDGPAIGSQLAPEIRVKVWTGFVERGDVAVATAALAVGLGVVGVEVVAAREGSVAARHPADMGLLL